MDGLRALAVNSYNQLWSEEQKRGAQSYFNNLDSDGDKKVSLEELKEKNIISNELFYVYCSLDVNGDKTLDFEEILPLYYFKHVMAKDVVAYEPKRRFCKGLCGRMQERPDFSCFLCLTRSLRRSYHLCSSCHAKGKHLKHKHPHWCMLSRQSLDMVQELKSLLFQDNNYYKVRTYKN